MTPECFSTRSSPSRIAARDIPPTTMRARSFFRCCWGKWKARLLERSNPSTEASASPLFVVPGTCLQSSEGQVQKFPALRSALERASRIRGYPWTGLVGTWNGSGPIRRSGIERRGRAPVRVFASRGVGIQQPAGMGLQLARDSGIPHCVSRRSRRAENAIRPQPAVAGNV